VEVTNGGFTYTVSSTHCVSTVYGQDLGIRTVRCKMHKVNVS